MRSKTISIVAIVLLIVTVRHAVAEEPFGAAARSWALYGGDAGGSRYSPLNQIASVDHCVIPRGFSHPSGNYIARESNG
jgi:hypothetical protein